MNTIEVKLDTRTIIVKKLPLGKYQELLKALKKLPQQINGLSGVKNEDLIQRLPTLLSESLPDFIDVLKVATDINEKEVNEIGMAEAVDLFIAIIEVNRFSDVYNNIKKAMARFQEPKVVS